MAYIRKGRNVHVTLPASVLKPGQSASASVDLPTAVEYAGGDARAGYETLVGRPLPVNSALPVGSKPFRVRVHEELLPSGIGSGFSAGIKAPAGYVMHITSWRSRDAAGAGSSFGAGYDVRMIATMLVNDRVEIGCESVEFTPLGGWAPSNAYLYGDDLARVGFRSTSYSPGNVGMRGYADLQGVYLLANNLPPEAADLVVGEVRCVK